jgi:hypothetical protein
VHSLFSKKHQYPAGVQEKTKKSNTMKNVSNFLVGTLSSLGVSAALPDSVNTVSSLSPTVINSLEALVSLLSGLLSAFLVAWLKRKWEKK